MHVKKGDVVVVRSGNDRGKSGEVKAVHRKEGRVTVEGVNLRWRHKRPTQQNPKGERVQREQPIHASNVARSEEQPAKRGGKKARKAERS